MYRLSARQRWSCAGSPIADATAISRRRLLQTVVCKDGKEPPKETGRVDGVIDQLKKKGVTPATAKQILRSWEKLGVSDPDKLRKLLVSQSVQPVGGLVVQLLLDTIAAAGGFFTGSIAGQAEEFTGQLAVQLLGYFIGCYYGIQVFFEFGAIATLLLAAAKYGANTVELLRAVQELAGPTTGLTVMEKAQLAANSLKVLQTLDAIAEMLKAESSEPTADTLRNLSAYLTLRRAEEVFGFQPEKYGLSEKEAGNIALVFSRFDTNDDARLDLRDLSQLCSSLGKDLSEAEVLAARDLLDTDKNGFVEFEEFVAWWVKDRTTKPEAATI